MLSEYCTEIVKQNFPQTNLLSGAFAYGSAVLPQSSSHTQNREKQHENRTIPPAEEGSASKMIDFIFITKDGQNNSWHAANLERDFNKSHYSLPFQFSGARGVDFWQRRLFGPEVFFNTLAKVKTPRPITVASVASPSSLFVTKKPGSLVTIKYGVVSEADLVRDLTQWRWLYLAGRMHKPVRWVLPESASAANQSTVQSASDEADVLTQKALPPKLKAAQTINLCASLAAALLLLPHTFSARALYQTIAGISYHGDFRMLIGEDKNKVRNIAANQTAQFTRLYQPIMHEYFAQHLQPQNSEFQQDQSVAARQSLFSCLPSSVQSRLSANQIEELVNKPIRLAGEVGNVGQSNELAAQQSRSALSAVLRRIVCVSSIIQTAKNVPPAGFEKSFFYAMQKIMKQLKSIR